MRFKTFLRLLEGEIQQKFVEKDGINFFNDDFEGLNAGNGQCMIHHWKAECLNFHVIYPELAISRVQRSYRASKSRHSFFWGIFVYVFASSYSKSAPK